MVIYTCLKDSRVGDVQGRNKGTSRVWIRLNNHKKGHYVSIEPDKMSCDPTGTI